MPLTTEEILDMPGVVVRRLPKTVVSRWRQYLSHHGEFRPTKSRKVVEGPNSDGLYIVEETRAVSDELAGKILLTFVHGTGQQVHFSRKRDGVGNSVVEAYKNYLRVRSKSAAFG